MGVNAVMNPPYSLLLKSSIGGPQGSGPKEKEKEKTCYKLLAPQNSVGRELLDGCRDTFCNLRFVNNNGKDTLPTCLVWDELVDRNKQRFDVIWACGICAHIYENFLDTHTLNDEEIARALAVLILITSDAEVPTPKNAKPNPNP